MLGSYSNLSDGDACLFHSRYEIGIGLVENKRSWTTAEHELAVEAGAAPVWQALPSPPGSTVKSKAS